MSIRKRSKGYQVRIAPFPAQTVPTKAAAERLELALRMRKAGGDVESVEPTTLGAEIDGFLARLRATGGLRPRSIEFYEQKSKVWTPLRSVKVSALRRARIEDMTAERATAHPRSATDELQFLKRVLKDARGRGQRIDDAILEIRPVRHRAKEGRALNVGELYQLASFFPEHVSRLVLLAGQVGARQTVWFELTDDLLDLGSGTMTIPAALAKNRKEHRVYLTPTEIGLLRGQLMARAVRSSLVFPRPDGTEWDRSRFGELWRLCVRTAATDSETGSPVFANFNFHLLRHTAGSLMALAGMDPAVAAERLGHSDGGALFLTTYRHLYEGEKREQAAKLDALVRESLDKAWTESQGGAANPYEQRASSMGAPGIEPAVPVSHAV